jgi:hypothetical protein
MKTRADWVADADAVLARVRSLLAPYGIAPDERLRIVTDSNPMPGYIHEDRTIAFCPPVIERGADLLRWMFFIRYMGAESLAEAEQFFTAALPVIISHELSHHLRLSRGLATTSNFVEEQVCNRLGTAIADAIPEFHDAIGPFCELCGTFADRLEKKLAAAGESVVGESVFVGAMGDALLVANAVGRRTLDRLEAFAESRDVSSEAIVALSPRVTPQDLAEAQASRAGAQRFMDTQYTADPAAYWMLSLRWLHTCFSRPRENRPSLQPVLLEHLLREPDNVAELSMALRAMLASDVASLAFSGDRTCGPALRAAAAAGLLELEGPVAAPLIVERAIQSGEPEEGLVDALGRAWKREEIWDPRCVEPLVTVAQNTIGTMSTGALRRFVRLIGLSGIDVVLPIARLQSRAIEDPLLAAELAAFDASQRLSGSEAWISGADVRPELLEAWQAHGRLLSELPAAFLDRCLAGDPSGRVRRALLRMSAGACDPDDDRWAGLALLEIVSATTADSPADARIAHAIVDSASTDALSAALSRRLPPRGGAEWEALLSFLDRTPEAREMLVRIARHGRWHCVQAPRCATSRRFRSARTRGSTPWPQRPRGKPGRCSPWRARSTPCPPLGGKEQMGSRPFWHRHCAGRHSAGLSKSSARLSRPIVPPPSERWRTTHAGSALPWTTCSPNCCWAHRPRHTARRCETSCAAETTERQTRPLLPPETFPSSR